MAGRKTHLDVATYSLGGTSFLGDLVSADFPLEAVVQEGKNVGARFGEAVVVKRRIAFTAQQEITATSVRQTNLETSLFTIGATAYLGDLQDGTIKVATVKKEGSGQADEWEYPVACGTDVVVTGNLKIDSAATGSLAVTMAGVRSGLILSVSITTGGFQFVQSMKLVKVGKQFERDGIIMVPVELRCKLTAPGTATGNTLIVLILTGTSICTYAVDDSVDSISGNALVTEATLSFSDATVTSLSLSLENQGTPTVV